MKAAILGKKVGMTDSLQMPGNISPAQLSKLVLVL